jgi:hypothetical protein
LAIECESKAPFPDRYRTFVNNKLGETYEEKGTEVDPTGLMERRESYAASPLPESVCVLTGRGRQDGRRNRSWGWDREENQIEYIVVLVTRQHRSCVVDERCWRHTSVGRSFAFSMLWTRAAACPVGLRFCCDAMPADLPSRVPARTPIIRRPMLAFVLALGRSASMIAADPGRPVTVTSQRAWGRSTSTV